MKPVKVWSLATLTRKKERKILATRKQFRTSREARYSVSW